MKLPEVILISLAIAFLIIGVHQMITIGFGNAYWALMLALLFFFIYNLRIRRR